MFKALASIAWLVCTALCGVGAAAAESTPVLAAEAPSGLLPPASERALALTAEERQWLAEHPVVRVLSDAASPPFDFIGSDGRREGLAVDYLVELARTTGLRFEWARETRRERLLDAARGGQGQLVAGFALPEATQKDFVPVRRSLATDYPVLVVRRDAGDFAATAAEHQRVSLVRGYAPAQDYAQRMQARQYLNSEGFEPALVDVAVGRTDLTIQSLAVAEFLIRQRGLTGLKIAGPYGQPQSSGYAVQWSVPVAAAPLAAILEKAWDSLPPERHRALRARWLDRPQVAPGVEPPLHAVAAAGSSTLLALLAALLLAVLLLVALALWQWRRLSRLAAPRAESRAQRVERVLDGSPALIFEMEKTHSGSLVVRYASREARQMFAIELADETLPIEAFLRTIYPEDQTVVITAIQKSAAERRELEQEYRVLSPQGLRWVKSVIRPREEGSGKTVWSGITVDISQQKRAELRTEQADQRLREMTDNTPGVIFQMQRDLGGKMRLNFASAALFSTRGVKIEDFNRDGEAFYSSMHEDDRETVQAALAHSAMDLSPLDIQYRVRMGDGRIEWMNTTAATTRNRDGLVVWNGYAANVTRLQEAEQGRERAQRFLSELTDGVPGFIFQMRRDSRETPYRFTFASMGVSAHGLKPAEVIEDIGRLYESVDPDDRQRLTAAIDRSFASLTPYRVDYRLRLPSGLTAWMRAQAVPVREASGAVVWSGIALNISAEKLREAQAQRAEQRLQSITNALPGLVFQMAMTPEGDFVYTYMSDGARGIYQLEPDAVIHDATLVHGLVFTEDSRRLQAALIESADSRTEMLREYRIHRGDGVLRWLRTLARPQGYEGDSFVWNGFTQDITAEKEGSSRADALQRRLVEVTENVPCTVFQIQRDFEDELKMGFVSENIYGLIGISREALLEDIKVLIERLVPDDLPVMMLAMEASQRDLKPVFFDIRVHDTAGSLRWLRGSLSMPRAEDGGMVWNGAWLDITDIKELETELAAAIQQADAANRLKSEFLATMSHEIRTPMNAIIGLGQLMLATPLAGAQRSYLEKINTASQSLLGILNDILDHSKIEAGKMSVERVEFDLNAVLDNLSAVTHLKAVEKDLELRFEVPPGLPMRLMGDPLRLGQVLLNLVSNAIKFSERGTVAVRVREASRDGDELRLGFEVSDEGIGLSRQQIDRLFHSFAQGDASTTRKYGGTGLGLSISRNLIRLMDGDIAVESVPGVGSTFRFEAAVGIALVAQPRYDLPRDLYGLPALVVDDNPQTRAATEGWLQAFGFKVSGVEGGLACLETLHSAAEPYALIVLDWRMPGLNGLETAQRIRQNWPLPPPALLMASAYLNDELVRQCELVDVRDFLAKPFSPSALYHSVLAAMGRAEASALPLPVPQPLLGLRVLVADDNEVNLEIACGILEAAGAVVRQARDGEEVVSRLAATEFDVLLLDLQMPRLDGLEVARRVRADPRLAGLPLVAMTAHAMPEHREASARAGFDAHLLKPIDRRELFDTLMRYLPGAPRHVSEPGLPPLLAHTEKPATTQAFDRAAALLRLGGNQSLLDRLLARFSSDHAQAAQQIIAAVEQGDQERAVREAHTLKGVAANLGASLLADAASAVEMAIRHQGIAAGELLDTLRLQQQETLRAMQASLEMAPTAAAAPLELRETLKHIVADLQTLLAAHDASAKDAHELLHQRLQGMPKPSLLRLRSAVENYDFEVALAALQEVQRDFNLH